MVETEEGGTELQLALFGDQVCVRENRTTRDEPMRGYSQMAGGHPKAHTSASDRRGTQILQKQVEHIMTQW